MRGIGFPAGLRTLHPNLSDPEAALEKSLWPHISGTFEEGLTGTQQNAGMGLFFIAEMAKLTGGTLLIATRGATLLLSGWVDEEGNHSLRFIEPRGAVSPERSSCSSCPSEAWSTTPRSSRPSRSGRSNARPASPPSLDPVRVPPPSEATVFEVQNQAENTPAAIAARPGRNHAAHSPA